MDMPDGNTAALRIYERGQVDLTEEDEAEEAEAIDSIVDDYLLLGNSYPMKGGRECVTAGLIALRYLDDEELENILSALVYGCGNFLDSRQRFVEQLVKDNASEYLREKFPRLIERRVEEMRDEA